MLHSASEDTPSVFRFHIQHEPDSLDPARSLSPISSYVLNSLYVPLLTYQAGQLGPGGATSCAKISALLYRCVLRSDWFWSDGVKVDSAQILAGFMALRSEKSVRLSHLANIKDVQARSPLEIDFYLKKPDSDFTYKLLDPSLGPRRKNLDLKSGEITYGAYYLSERKPGRSLYLKPNDKFYVTQAARPHIEVLIVDADSTALRLYEAKKLSLMRRLPTENVPTYKDSPHLMQKPLHRIDYVGFSPVLDSYPDLRNRLIFSLAPQYKKFMKIFSALGRPGCFGLEESIVGKNLCYEDRAVSAYSKLELAKLPPLSLNFSLQGGDDISRTMEFFQAGWKQNLHLDIELRSTENSVLTAMLKSSPPPLFRRGVQLESPTCLAALEIFESSSPENYLQLKNKELDTVIDKLRLAASPNDSALCAKGLKALLAARRIIPMGAIHFAMLTDLNFTGFQINELNQLDVSRLSAKAPQTKAR